jgi:ABC-2 type transport system ATP-binding protein
LGYDVTDAGDAREIKRRIGVLPQQFNALDKLTVRENVAMFAAMYEGPRDPDELIRLLDLEDKTDTRFDKLSGGLKQRVGVVASLVNDPEIVFLDEPTMGLDPKSRREVWQVIERLKAENRTVFLTSHYMEEAERLADRIAIIVQGSIAAIGRTTELLRKYGGERMLLVEDVRPEKMDEVGSELPEATPLNGDIAIPVQDLKEIGQTIEVLDRFGVTGKDVRIRNPIIETVFLELVGARITREEELA